MFEAIYQKTKITEHTLRPAAILRLRVFATLLVILTPIFTTLKFTQMLDVLGGGFELTITVLFMACLIPLAFSRLANMMIFTDKRLDEWEIRVKKQAEAFAFRWLIFGLMGAAFVFGLLLDAEWLNQRRFSYHEVLYVPATLLFWATTLPALYASWTQKPLELGEEVDSLSEVIV
ncbi:MAG: hypothetical protein ABJG88_07270 [Litorimonas sp.]